MNLPPNSQKKKTVFWIALLCFAGAWLCLRLAALSSDPYPALSWSTALLTDEGFYLHDGRNRILFGIGRQDEFTNSLIMPLLDAAQREVFFQFGVGFVQTRLISVVGSLFSLLCLVSGVRRIGGNKAACLTALFYGLDHITLLYSRMGLMDTPALFPMTLAFELFTRVLYRTGPEGSLPEAKIEFRGFALLAAAGSAAAAAYAVRGLSLLLVPAPFLALKAVPLSSLETRRAFLALAFGLSLGGTIYALFWFLPHRSALSEVNRFYLTHQLLPHSPLALLKNLGNALFGVERGMFPFLLRHTPLLTLGTVWMLCRSLRGEKFSPGTVFLLVWAAFGWTLCSLISYSPSRYFVLFLPAMSALCGLWLSELSNEEGRSFSPLSKRMAVSFGLYHFTLVLSRSHSPAAFAFAAGSGVLGLLLPSDRIFLPLNFSPPKGFVSLWAAVNFGWLLHWAFTLGFTQQNAVHWLKANLPQNAVLYGDVAAGLAPDLPFRVVPVIPGLCNESLPVIVTDSPRFLLLLGDPLTPPFWKERYPFLLTPERQVKTFSSLVGFPATLYRMDRTFR